MYNIKLQQFEGPLDLLLKLIEDRKISINDISLASITGDYLNYMKSLSESPERNISEFIEVAATLALVKSKSLLPILEITKEEESSITELKEKLQIYKAFKNLSLKIAPMFQKREVCFGRQAFLNVSFDLFEPKNLNVLQLSEVLGYVVSKFMPKRMMPKKVLRQTMSLSQKIKEIQSRIHLLTSNSFSGIANSKDKMEIIVSFFAVLELIKQGLLVAEQGNDFGEITVIRN